MDHAENQGERQPGTQLALDRHHELATFLRSRRARLSPEAAGLPRGTRRRTPGLRRAEVAMLAGVSPEWYTWLEQGRNINVSGQVLESLAKALQMDAKEREHLFLLAVRQPPALESFTTTTISATLRQFLDQLEAIPACVLDSRFNVVAWNAAYCAVFGDFAPLTGRERNLIWRVFMAPARPESTEWAELLRVLAAQFRIEYGRFINDPWWTQQISELSQHSAAFREIWARHDVLTVSEGRKSMPHPLVGELAFDFLWLQTVESPDLRLLIHTPRRNTGTAEKITRLLALAHDAA